MNREEEENNKNKSLRKFEAIAVLIEVHQNKAVGRTGKRSRKIITVKLIRRRVVSERQ